MFHRRDILALGAAGIGASLLPGIAFARAATERRFVFIIQRGAADGLNIVIPHGDNDYAKLRGALAIDPTEATKLDGQFSLHPSLARTAEFYRGGEALFVHAIASPYRERSHFDGQNVLETGGEGPYALKDGWLNRLGAMLPGDDDKAVALAATIPLALRGTARVVSYAPSGLPGANDDLLARVDQLYADDALLHPLWAAAISAQNMARQSGGRQDPASLGRLAASFLARPDGPRLAMIETNGWDTHSAQPSRLAAQLKALDTLVGAMRDALGPTWAQTSILVATEFGRTAAANGTNGTDHGTASAAMLIGGAVRGGRVLADWPGLGQSALYEGRDLKPTIALDALVAGAAAEGLGLDPAQVARTLFPATPKLRPVQELARS